ncbi:hypothetical protein ACFWH4_14235, partial [Streptomyces sp. NPDC127091]
MSRSHGSAGEFGAQAWAAPSRTPLYYPDAVTLVPGAGAAPRGARRGPPPTPAPRHGRHPRPPPT